MEQDRPPSSGSSGSPSARMGDRRPLRVEADELALEWRSVQASNSPSVADTAPVPGRLFRDGLLLSGEFWSPTTADPGPIPGRPTLLPLIRPLLFKYLVLLSMETALRRGAFPIFPPSGFSIHQELFPVPSFCTRMKRVWRDRLCRMEFCRERKDIKLVSNIQYATLIALCMLTSFFKATMLKTLRCQYS